MASFANKIPRTYMTGRRLKRDGNLVFTPVYNKPLLPAIASPSTLHHLADNVVRCYHERQRKGPR